MGCCDCPSKPKQPRKKREKPYSKVNAYTQPFSCQQIITVLIVITQITLHSVFVVPALPNIGSTVLWVMTGYFYTVLLFIIYDYITLTTFDPVDPLVQQQDQAEKYAVGELKFCLLCDCQVHASSYHCRRCHRCTVEFDHHCTFLNNCIGSRNYEAFFRILLTYASFSGDAVAMAIWTATKTFRNGQLTFDRAEWGMIASAAVSLVSFTAVGCLLTFHCYITCCEHTTTYNLNHSPLNDAANSERDNIRQNPPASQRRLALQNRFS